jgi:monoterpene epsilon-lactone hydrolase
MPSEEFDNLIAMLTSSPRPADTSVADFRALYDSLAGLIPLAAGVEVEPAELGGAKGLWVTPPDAEDRVVLHLHGGGYVIGSTTSHRPVATHLAAAARARLFLAEYRLAPEHPHPAALDDAVSAYRALLDGGAQPGRTVIAGDSAGGGLTLATLPVRQVAPRGRERSVREGAPARRRVKRSEKCGRQRVRPSRFRRNAGAFRGSPCRAC